MEKEGSDVLLLGSSSVAKQPGRSPRQPLLQAYRLRQVTSASPACPASTGKLMSRNLAQQHR